MEICSLADEENLEEWTLYTDGASSSKGVGDGFVLIDPLRIEYTYAIRQKFPSTNNEAEYEALLAGLQIAEQNEGVLLAVQASRYQGSVDKCDSCQIHALVPRLPKTYLTSIISPWPFYQWGLDILGTLSEGLDKLKFIIVAIEYFTKWMEAKPLAKTIGKEVLKFVWQNIVYRFGLPRVIMTDNGTQLVNDLFKSWREKWKIKHINMAVAHPQANGLVERANARPQGKVRTRKSRMGRRGGNSGRDRVEYFMYRRNEASRVENQGKLGPNWEGPYRVIEAYDNGSYKLCTMNDREVPCTWHAINLQN
ncbi:reverse transcriptase domain-containing protein [Tanacetum coccineum]